MYNGNRLKIFGFNLIMVVFSLLLVSLTNTIMAQQQDFISTPGSFNKSEQSENVSALLDTSVTGSNTSYNLSGLSSIFTKNEKSIVSIITTFPTNNSSENSSGALENSSTISNNQSNAFGTGFIYDTKGHIITTDSIIVGSHYKK